MMEAYTIQMIKCLLAKYYSSIGFKAEIFEKSTFDIEAMDKRWEELFYMNIKDDSEGCWELTECEVEPMFCMSLDTDNNSWKWEVGRKLWFNDHYIIIYEDEGECEEFEDALASALDVFEQLGTEFEVTDLEDIDDSIT